MELRAEEESTGCPQNWDFFEGGSHVWPRFSQLFFLEIVEFLYSLERKYPEFSETPPTFIPSSFLIPSMTVWTLNTVFFGTPCTVEKNRWNKKEEGRCPKACTDMDKCKRRNQRHNQDKVLTPRNITDCNTPEPVPRYF